MIRFLLLLTLFPAGAQAETLTSAYFVGKDQLAEWEARENQPLKPP